jgi:vancomycin resistance protein YoaR
MATRHAGIALNSSTAVQITGIEDLNNRKGISIVLNNNHATAIIYVGATASTSSTNFGFHLDPNARVVLSGEFDASDVMYAIASAGTPSLRVMVVGG